MALRDTRTRCSQEVRLYSTQTAAGQRVAQLLPSPSVNVAPSQPPLLASVHITPSPDHVGPWHALKQSPVNLHVCQNVHIPGELLKVCIGKNQMPKKNKVVKVSDLQPSTRLTLNRAMPHDPPAPATFSTSTTHLAEEIRQDQLSIRRCLLEQNPSSSLSARFFPFRTGEDFQLGKKREKKKNPSNSTPTPN